jgi:hypothetical protein
MSEGFVLPPTYYDGLDFDGTDDGALLPYLPTWPGFALDTLFYAALLWLPLQLRRRRRRIRRGLCPGCACPVGKSTVCGECGRSLRRPRQ